MATGGTEECLSDEYFDIKCTVCLKKNKQRQAANYCSDCKKNFCVSCINIHNDLHDDHTVGECRGDENKEVLIEKCDEHPEKVIEFYCLSHDKLACSLCVLNHRGCRDMKHIRDSYDILIKDKTIKGVPANLKTAVDNIDHVIDTLDQHLEVLLQEKDNVLHEIEKYTKLLLSKIEELKRKANEFSTVRFAALESAANQRRKNCLKAKTDINRCMQNFKKLQRNSLHMLVLAKKGQTLSMKSDTLCQEVEALIKHRKILLRPDLTISECINRFTSLLVEECSNEPFTQVKMRKKYTGTLVRRLDVRVNRHMTHPRIEGSCLLPDQRILLTDDINRLLMRVDPYSGKVTDHLQIQEQPQKIAIIGQQEVVVCTGSTQVLVVSLGNKLTCSRAIELGHKTSCLVINNGEIYASDGDSVFVHDMFGKLKRTIYHHSSGYWSISDLALSPSGDRVYIADLINGLICVSGEGKEIFRCTLQALGLYRPTGLVTDHQDNILVCGYESHNVVQVTVNGEVVGQILSSADGIQSPRSMCYSEATHKLYVVADNSGVLEFDLQ